VKHRKQLRYFQGLLNKIQRLSRTVKKSRTFSGCGNPVMLKFFWMNDAVRVNFSYKKQYKNRRWNVISLNQPRGMSAKNGCEWYSNPCPHQPQTYPGIEVAAILKRKTAVATLMHVTSKLPVVLLMHVSFFYL